MRLRAGCDLKGGDFVARRGFWFWRRAVLPYERKRILKGIRVCEVLGYAKHSVKRGQSVDIQPISSTDWFLMPVQPKENV